MSESNETVSQKLRRWVKESENEPTYPSLIAYEELFGDTRAFTTKEDREVFERLADMVEEEEASLHLTKIKLGIDKPMRKDDDIKMWHYRWSLPRPAFEDGEPVQFGDRYVDSNDFNQTLSSLTYTKGSTGYVWLNGNDRRPIDEPIKRPAPKMLDADGVPIEVGDTVWNAESGNRFCVRCLDPFEVSGFGGVSSTWFQPKEFTHREPDSLEKLRDAIKARTSDPQGATWGEVTAWAKRLTAIIERGA